MSQLLINKIAQNSDQISFAEVIDYIDIHYHFTPTAFQNGETHNAVNQNNGSCKIFSFAHIQQFTKEQTLRLFGDYYQDVLENPDKTDHQNIRNFMKYGWDGVKFEAIALLEK
jgi:hypothetical protein